jgi:hypothetical protein
VAVRRLLAVTVAAMVTVVDVFVALCGRTRVETGLLSVEIWINRYPPSGGFGKEMFTD